MSSSKSDPNHPPRSALGALGLAFAALLATGACEDTKIIEVERPFFPEPPANAGGFLGFDEIEASLTVCGNCHVGQQAGWEGTAHADAWASLQASGSAQAFCEGCHSVSEQGNVASGQVGYAATQDPRYQDVQCESCHGPGAQHVANPDASAPFASLSVSFEAGAAGLSPAQDAEYGCADCHEGTHHPFVEEWSQSPHARVVEYPAGNPSCQGCHRGQNTLIAWGENADYIEKNSAEHLPVVCGVCHDPHEHNFEGQLRFPVDTPELEENLCARCHNRRTAPLATSSHGLEPHSPEAALLIGDAGWFPPGANIDQGQILGTHGTDLNPRSCATCHLPMFEVTDQSTGAFVFNTVGHLFRPIPCVDAQGIPQPFEVQCGFTTAERSFKACTGGACHGTEATAAAALLSAKADVERLVEDLRELLLEVDPNLEAPGGEIDPNNPTFTVAEGAFFNMELAEFGNEEFGTDNVVGSTVHNPFLVRALLIASLNAVEEEYGIQASIAADWDAELREVLRRVP